MVYRSFWATTELATTEQRAHRGAIGSCSRWIVGALESDLLTHP